MNDGVNEGVSDGARDAVSDAVAAAYAGEWGRIVASLIRFTGDWDLAEECAQDAFARAVERWPRDGVPRRPGAWLTTTARNRALDRLRRARTEARAVREVAGLADRAPAAAPTGQEDGVDGDGALPDDRLRLIFTCCHPALVPEARVALTLRSLAGLSTAEIAHAFLVSESTMAQRLVRAKNKIRHARIPFRVPSADRLPERTAAVLSVLYLLYNEGYGASAGAVPIRRELTAEAVRLTRVLAGLLPDDTEVRGLLALMLLHDSRRAARVDACGELVPLERQDRSLWDRDGIAEGLSVLEDALLRRRPGPYQVQAAVAACHATASDAADTDWPQIALLYRELAKWSPGPVVELNRAVAVAMSEGPEHGLALVEGLAAAGELTGYFPLYATRADLLRRLERWDGAVDAYREAVALAPTDAERRHLARRLAEAEAQGGQGPER
ncbi:RNA polymerase sigma factor [Streptomyces sp. NBC_01317]|uniref:RNA polymerase sigma factor n=1 Tax=Streptomyces sp. NBC_01317 TaxID=2903822 RepID=UPI002E109650|nr:RNA polymerase sigma factor [Streptomyces sp. NBC_01317]